VACGLHLLDCLSEHQSGKPLYLRVTRTAPAKDRMSYCQDLQTKIFQAASS
jgi:hypothetical protein